MTRPDGLHEGWTDPAGAADLRSAGHERFRSPGEDVAVSAWTDDPGADVSLESIDEIVAWAEDFCQQTDPAPCTGIATRALPLCREQRDCHAALLVPFQDDTYAFVPGWADDGSMIIVAVWRPEGDPSVVRYGGARNLLLAFLSTINGGGNAGVYPAP